MCAIACLIAASARAEILSHIEAMTETVAHRGPDGFGHMQLGQVALGHRRLAIVDVSEAGRQPMEFKNLTITYNGEIYNYREQRGAKPGRLHLPHRKRHRSALSRL
jgi:asparagine synthase (glutamine-hydrolysing)